MRQIKIVLYLLILYLFCTTSIFGQRIDPPSGYTEHYGFRLYAQGSRPGADSINQNYIDIDQVLYDLIIEVNPSYFYLDGDTVLTFTSSFLARLDSAGVPFFIRGKDTSGTDIDTTSQFLQFEEGSGLYVRQDNDTVKVFIDGLASQLTFLGKDTSGTDISQTTRFLRFEDNSGIYTRLDGDTLKVFLSSHFQKMKMPNGDDLEAEGSDSMSVDATKSVYVLGDNTPGDKKMTIELVNDETTPGNNKIYGTDGTGTKGWIDQFLPTTARDFRAAEDLIAGELVRIFDSTGTSFIKSLTEVTTYLDQDSISGVGFTLSNAVISLDSSASSSKYAVLTRSGSSDYVTIVDVTGDALTLGTPLLVNSASTSTGGLCTQNSSTFLYMYGPSSGTKCYFKKYSVTGTTPSLVWTDSLYTTYGVFPFTQAVGQIGATRYVMAAASGGAARNTIFEANTGIVKVDSAVIKASGLNAGGAQVIVLGPSRWITAYSIDLGGGDRQPGVTASKYWGSFQTGSNQVLAKPLIQTAIDKGAKADYNKFIATLRTASPLRLYLQVATVDTASLAITTGSAVLPANGNDRIRAAFAQINVDSLLMITSYFTGDIIKKEIVTIAGTVPTVTAPTTIFTGNDTEIAFAYNQTTGLLVYRRTGETNNELATLYSLSDAGGVRTLYDTYVGVVQETGNAGDTLGVVLVGGVSSVHSGLTRGEVYYISNSGTLTTSTASGYFAGIGISTTELLAWRDVKGVSSDPIVPDPDRTSVTTNSSVTNDFSVANGILSGVMLKFVIVQNTTANAFRVNIGSTPGGNDIVNNLNVPANYITTFVINKVFSYSGSTTIYVTDGATGWNSSNSDFRFVLEDTN